MTLLQLVNVDLTLAGLQRIRVGGGPRSIFIPPALFKIDGGTVALSTSWANYFVGISINDPSGIFIPFGLLPSYVSSLYSAAPITDIYYVVGNGYHPGAPQLSLGLSDGLTLIYNAPLPVGAAAYNFVPPVTLLGR